MEETVKKEKIEWIATQIVDSAFQVYKEMGPGLLESVYEFCLAKELELRGIRYECQTKIPLVYKGNKIGKDFFIDILVEDDIILELKAVETILPVHEAQIISYLKLAKKNLGFLINFNVPRFSNNVRRFVNEY